MKKLIIFLFGLFCLPGLIKAEKIYFGEKLAGEYIGKYYDDKIFGEQVTKIYSSNSDKLLFRINPKGNVYDFAMKSTANFASFGMSLNTIKTINLLAYYGYQFEDRTDDYWYSVVQFLIYKQNHLGVKIFYTDALNGKEKAKYAVHFAKILKLVNEHDIVPNFDKEYEIKTNNILKLSDNNNVLKNFTIKNASLVKGEIIDNELIITPLSSGKGYITLIKQGNKYDKAPEIYYNKEKQTFLLPGNFKPIEVKINFKISRGTLEINVKDDFDEINPLLEKSNFKINDKNYYVENGKIGPIEIYDEEINISQLSGHVMYDFSESINLKYSEAYEDKIVNIKNRLIRADLKVISDPNVKLNIYQNDMLINTITTDDRGIGNINLPYGKYLIESPFDTINYQVDENTPSTDLITINIENPSTGDNICIYFSIVVSLIPMLSIIFIKKCIKYK